MINIWRQRLKNLRGLFAITASAMLISGCSQLLGPGNGIPGARSLNEGATLLPASNYHLITVRPAPQFIAPQSPPKANQDIMCTEPSPDWATALSTAINLSASGSAPSGPSASISGGGNTSEAITAMLGRTAGVVALRDGLYSACQAYANGIIGRDSYALIISQYGDLLVQLAGGSTASPSAATTPPAASTTTPTPIAVAVTTGAAASPSPAPSPTPSSTTTSGSAANPNVGLIQMETMQAMLVACIADFDGSDYYPNQNALLNMECPNFMENLNKEVGPLLTPAPPPTTTTTNKPTPTPTPPNTAKPSFSQPVFELQTMLRDKGDYTGPINGIYDQPTATAYTTYLQNLDKPAH